IGQAPKGLGSHALIDPWLSPDGKRLAFVERVSDDHADPRRRLSSLDLETQKVTRLAEAVLGHSIWLAWSPESTSLVFTSDEDGDLQAESLNLVTISDPKPRRIAELAPSHQEKNRTLWGPDGSSIAYLAPIPNFRSAANLTIQKVADGQTRVLRRVANGSELVWSSDGQAIGYIESERKSGDFKFRRILVADGSEEVTPFSL